MKRRLIFPGADWLLPAVLSTTAGAVDVIGFLTLGGLLTAHITGNLVVLAAHYVIGRFGEIGPLPGWCGAGPCLLKALNSQLSGLIPPALVEAVTFFYTSRRYSWAFTLSGRTWCGV
jgi:hypothetical protein